MRTKCPFRGFRFQGWEASQWKQKEVAQMSTAAEMDTVELALRPLSFCVGKPTPKICVGRDGGGKPGV